MGNEAQVNHETGCSKKKKSIKWKISLPLSTFTFISSQKASKLLKCKSHMRNWVMTVTWNAQFSSHNARMSLSVYCKKFLYLLKLATGKSRGRSRFWLFKSFIFDSSAHTTTRWSCWSCKGRVWAVKKWMRKQTKKNKKILAAFH